MHKADEYREMAEECFEWAKTALSEEVRLTYLNIAQIWLQAAASLDAGLPIRLAPLPPAKGNGKLPEPLLSGRRNISDN
jgi:hypothetical protein